LSIQFVKSILTIFSTCVEQNRLMKNNEKIYKMMLAVLKTRKTEIIAMPNTP